ncbi:MAG: hypothetical protein ACTS45_01545, partial [Candidatus Hodgkinia cicadicola]
MPNATGNYTETAEAFANKINNISEVVGAIGGCCGS